MIRSLFVVMPIGVLVGSTIIGVLQNLPKPCVAPRTTFAQVQDAVARVETAHMVFRMACEETFTLATTYEAWLKTDRPAYVVQTSAGRIIGDENGVRQVQADNTSIALSREPVTEAVVRKEMLLPRFSQASTAPDRWSRCRIQEDVAGRRLLQFVSEKNGVRRTLWVDPRTHLPTRIDIEMHASETEAAPGAPIVSQFHVIYFWNNKVPKGIFAPPKKDTALLATRD